MEPYKDDNDLAAELRALRPEPRPEFAAELDERAAAGFPRRSRPARSPLGGILARLRAAAAAAPGVLRPAPPRSRDRRRDRGRRERWIPIRPGRSPEPAPIVRTPRRSAPRTPAYRESSQGAAEELAEPSTRPQPPLAPPRVPGERRSSSANRPLRRQGRPPRGRTLGRDGARRRARRRRRRRGPGLRRGPRGRRDRPQLLGQRRRRGRCRRPLRPPDPGRQAQRRPRRLLRDRHRRLPPRGDRRHHRADGPHRRTPARLAGARSTACWSSSPAPTATKSGPRSKPSCGPSAATPPRCARRRRSWAGAPTSRGSRCGSRPAPARPRPTRTAAGASATPSTTPATSSASPPGSTIVGLAILAPLALIALLAWLANRARLRRARERALA